MKFIYLHGFASGPESSKATFFKQALAEAGVDLSVPPLDGGDFERLTISSQLAIVDREVAGEPVALIGSSMGGYLSALYASTHENVQRLVLLAPAFSFLTRWPESLGPEKMAAWRDSGLLEIFHHGYGEPRSLRYDLIEDGRRYPPVPGFTQPGLIFHGTGDDVVPSAYSESYAATNPNVRLRLLDSDHQLTGVTGAIWLEAKAFLLG